MNSKGQRSKKEKRGLNGGLEEMIYLGLMKVLQSSSFSEAVSYLKERLGELREYGIDPKESMEIQKVLAGCLFLGMKRREKDRGESWLEEITREINSYASCFSQVIDKEKIREQVVSLKKKEYQIKISSLVKEILKAPGEFLFQWIEKYEEVRKGMVREVGCSDLEKILFVDGEGRPVNVDEVVYMTGIQKILEGLEEKLGKLPEILLAKEDFYRDFLKRKDLVEKYFSFLEERSLPQRKKIINRKVVSLREHWQSLENIFKERRRSSEEIIREAAGDLYALVIEAKDDYQIAIEEKKTTEEIHKKRNNLLVAFNLYVSFYSSYLSILEKPVETSEREGVGKGNQRYWPPSQLKEEISELVQGNYEKKELS